MRYNNYKKSARKWLLSRHKSCGHPSLRSFLFRIWILIFIYISESKFLLHSSAYWQKTIWWIFFNFIFFLTILIKKDSYLWLFRSKKCFRALVIDNFWNFRVKGWDFIEDMKRISSRPKRFSKSKGWVIIFDRLNRPNVSHCGYFVHRWYS